MCQKEDETLQAADEELGDFACVEELPQAPQVAAGQDVFVEGLQELLNRAVRVGMDAAGGVDPQMRELLQSLNDNLERLLERQASAETQAASDEESSTDSGASQKLPAEIEGRLDAICETVAELRSASERAAQDPETAPPWAEALSTRLDEFLAQQTYQPAQSPEAAFAAAEPVEATQAPMGDNVCQSQLEKAVFGNELADDSEIVDQRQQLLKRVLQGEAAACNFAGVLLTFQAGNADRKRRLLSEVGEAFYHWRPEAGIHGHDPFEKSLKSALNTILGDLALGLRVETVHVGDRYEKNVHVTDGKGREVTQVKGWIVERDDGRAFARAKVDVR